MYMGGAAPSPAGPAESGDSLRDPPAITLPRSLQIMRFTQRQIEFVFRARRELGEVFRMDAGILGGTVVSEPPRSRSFAVHREARARALADRRVAAAADRRAELGADGQRRRVICASASCCWDRFTATRSSATHR